MEELFSQNRSLISCLNKALSVAKEIENAKHISETNYSMANKHNYEALEEEKKHFRNRKKKD